jgi:mycothiol synthase
MTRPTDAFDQRPAGWADIRGLTELLDAASQHWVARPTTAAQVSDRLNTPDTDVSRDTRCVLDDDGTIVGFGHLWPTHPDVVRCFARTHPAHRGRGVGTTLQRWVLARAAEIASAPAAEPMRTVSTTSWPGDIDAETLLAGAGYQAARYYLSMVADLSEDTPPPSATPEGFVLRTFQEGDEEALYTAYVEAFAEHWGFEHPRPSEWWGERRDSAASGFDPLLWQIAVCGDELVGFALARAQQDSEGVTHGYVGDLGVRPPWRGRGLGEALLTRSLDSFRERGIPSVTLDVDTENTSGAVRLYTEAGMRPRPSFTIWEQPLVPSADHPAALRERL